MMAPALVGTLLLACAGCHHRQGSTAFSAGPQADSIVDGTVSVTGTGFEQEIMLGRGSGELPLRLVATPGDSAALLHVAGLEIAARGEITGRTMRLRSFTAIRAGSLPVEDGILRLDGDHLILETAAGRLRLGNPPSALWQLVGARVWVSGPLDTGPNSYGVISR